MNETFDLIEAISERIARCRKRTGERPSSVFISPASYRRLPEIKAQEERIGNLIIRSARLDEVAPEDEAIALVIDELPADTAVEDESPSSLFCATRQDRV
jgi:hypothetical protein